MKQNSVINKTICILKNDERTTEYRKTKLHRSLTLFERIIEKYNDILEYRTFYNELKIINVL